MNISNQTFESTEPLSDIVFYKEYEHIFDNEYLNRLLLGITRDKQYLKESPYTSEFEGTQGYSILFKKSSMSKVCEEFPYFSDYLSFLSCSDANAFFLNPLLVFPGTEVKRHNDKVDSDGVMRFSWVPSEMIVSVLYISTPKDMAGGELTLEDPNSQEKITITPCSGKLVKFNGSVYHSISKVISESDKPRISLVCELYKLTSKELEKFPTYEIRN